MDLPPSPPPLLFPFLSFSFSSSGLLLGDVDPTKDCAWVAQGLRGGIREARRRLVRCGTLSLKYPEVFFPRNCRSPSFLGSLNGPGYPGRIEKLPLCSLSLSSSLSLFSFQPVSLALVPFFSPFLLAKQFIRASASQTAAHYSTTIKLPELCERVRSCMRSRGIPKIYYIVHELRIIRNNSETFIDRSPVMYINFHVFHSLCDRFRRSES